MEPLLVDSSYVPNLQPEAPEDPKNSAQRDSKFPNLTLEPLFGFYISLPGSSERSEVVQNSSLSQHLPSGLSIPLGIVVVLMRMAPIGSYI